jgi:hypothetical protein
VARRASGLTWRAASCRPEKADPISTTGKIRRLFLPLRNLLKTKETQNVT